MTSPEAVYQWTTLVRQHFPQLSKPQATVLALWSLGMVLARSCALSAVAVLLAVVLGHRPNTVRQQLREFCYAADAKRGTKRRAVVVHQCTVPLVSWVLQGYRGTQLALAIDATTLGDRFVVLAVSIVYRGCAIPVKWTVLEARTPHRWRRRQSWRHFDRSSCPGFFDGDSRSRRCSARTLGDLLTSAIAGTGERQ